MVYKWKFKYIKDFQTHERKFAFSFIFFDNCVFYIIMIDYT